jgi:hypothetical protein
MMCPPEGVREIIMQTRKQDPDAIAEEAVGQRHGDPPPYAVKENPDMSQEEMARRLSQLGRAFRRRPQRPSASELETRMPTPAAPPREIGPEKLLASPDRTRAQVQCAKYSMTSGS